MAPHPRDRKPGDALVRLEVIDELQLASAVAGADQWGQRLTEALLRLRLACEASLVDAVAQASTALLALLRERGYIDADQLRARKSRNPRGGA